MKLASFLGLWLLGIVCLKGQNANQIPYEELQVLKKPGKATLFSLNPEIQIDSQKPNQNQLSGVAIRGSVELDGKEEQDAAKAFQSAVENWDNLLGACFNPRHDLQIKANGHTYDFLLCYECHQMYLLKDNVLQKQLGACGTSKVLQAILMAHKVSYDPNELAQEESSIIWENEWNRQRAHWLKAMPASLVPLWTIARSQTSLPTARQALNKEFPDENQKIQILLEWYGTDLKYWAGSSEVYFVCDLLMDSSTNKIITALQTIKPTQNQILGAALLFSRRDFLNKRAKDLALVPDSLKKQLLEAIKNTKDQVSTDALNQAFKAQKIPTGIPLD